MRMSNKNDVRLELLRQPNRFFPAVRLADDLDFGVGQQAGQTGPNDLMVIANQ